jgi:DNA-binding XRE family transcriptional regulator/quercetin dioxygenase-like cupin family protein
VVDVPDPLTQVIGHRVQEARRRLGLAIRELAAQTGISKGMLSKIENAQVSPSLATLARLATGLQVPVTSLFRGFEEEHDAVFTKAGTGPTMVGQGQRGGHHYEQLGTLSGSRLRIEPTLVTLSQGTEVFPLFQHAGVEMLYVLEGVMVYLYGAATYRMEAGDTLQFDGDIPHGPLELVALPIRFLSIKVGP